jgi:dihydroorotase
VRLAVGLAREFDLEAHICHISTAGALEEIRAARRSGLPITCEVTPHHLAFDLDEPGGGRRDVFLQCNPPIRSRGDRLALLDGLRSGEIDMIASDHAPHSFEENERGISGIPHLDTFGPFLGRLAEEGVPWDVLVRAASSNPGRLLGRFLGGRFGAIEEGAAASLTALDFDRPWTVDRRDLRTKAGWSPFEGMRFPASVRLAVVRGRVYDAEAV